MNITPIPNTLVPVRKGDELMISIPHYWGKGPTMAEAKKNLEKAGGTSRSKYWRVHSVHPDTNIDEMGYINHPVNHAPVVLAECNPKS